MARYVCMWKDNNGVEHATEKVAREADVKIEVEYKKEVRRQNLIFKFRGEISGEKLPYFRYDDFYYGMNSGYPSRSEQNRDKMIEWIIKNEEMLKSVLNG